MIRVCAGCREPFSEYKPATAPVRLREGEPGHAVPRLRVDLWGSLCASCARSQAVRRRPR